MLREASMLQGLVTMLKGKDRDAEEEMEIKQRREGATERAELERKRQRSPSLRPAQQKTGQQDLHHLQCRSFHLPSPSPSE